MFQLLTVTSNSWVSRYLKILGIKKFIDLINLKLIKCLRNIVKRNLKKIFTPKTNFQKVKNWRYKKILIGPTIPNIQRINHLGSIDLENPIIKNELINKLPEFLSWVHKCENIIKTIKPDLIYLIEANDWNRPLVEVAISSNIQVIQINQPFRDDALIFKKLTRKSFGVHPTSITKTP